MMRPMRIRLGVWGWVLALAWCGLAASCGPSADVVLYCSLDRSHAEPVVAAFEEASGLTVEAYYDVEANKSVGLRRRLQEEAARPICDVFWNNEVVQMALLARAGLLQPYDSPSAADIPAQHKDPGHLWTGFAARGRVLIVNTRSRARGALWPHSSSDFLSPANSGRCGMAKPLTGTTAAHAGVWMAELGVEPALARFRAMQDNGVLFGPGNAHVMRLVRDGQLDFGFTDTDDCQAAIDEGYPVAMVVPDQGAKEEGLILIPNTIGLVAGAPHPDAGRQLIDFVLSPAVEEQLARGPSAQIPLRADVPRPPQVLDISTVKLAAVDWPAASAAYEAQADALEALFNR
jgi:iron(III) transport system substrate-binding protein